MSISVETLAVAKKYADSVASGSSASIADGSVTEKKLSTDLQNSIGNANEHLKGSIISDEGSHGLRYYNGALQYHDGTKWITLSIADLLI